ncbi:phosphatase inhibitor-domain-containing protein [Desarmillaria tabescens]|uniref:Type 1 phosphatases regulator n=1 Tax=Armillaria tabescens TaxID=1929756 RepID=A0AA39NPJ0_ARMTA|nr:phosphatase inhibitor-domain-containing protein [Desarmillaria tabescens]KAK0469441.1 phosphatase inhibitor-domain-containing protein [Desarmillaria tabescens]
MSSRTQTRSSTASPNDGSRTVTITNAPPVESSSSTPAVGSLRLRGARRKPRVAWSEDVVDNEGCGKKKSKICCIYHKPRRFDESSDEDSSSDESDSDEGHSCGDPNHSHKGKNGNIKKADSDHSESNAYESMPSNPSKDKGRVDN